MEVNGEAYHEQQEQQEKEECVICLDEVETEWRELACQHRYHKQCIENWITVRAKCPMCMKSIKDNNVEHINNNLAEEIHYIAIRRFLLFIFFIVSVIVVMVLCSQ
jgi:hypothetical protein